MAKMINKAVAGTIDERALNKPKKSKGLNPYQMGENQRLVIGSAKAIGCVVVNVHTSALVAGKPKQTLGLVWQIVRMQLMSRINLADCPEIFRLLEEGEDLDQLLALPPEDILIRWVNYHMKEAGNPRRLKRKTFCKDIKDSEIYTVLLNQIAPKACDKKALEASNMTARAKHVLRNAANLPAKTGSAKLIPLLEAAAITKGNKRLNYAFLAQIFNHNAGLLPDDSFDPASLLEDGEGTREERVFRMWMNSLLGPDGFYINSLYQDLRNGLHLLRVEDRVQPGCVPWKKVNKKPNTRFKTLILGIVWQLLREYTINLLQKLGGGKKIADKDIIKWANDKVKSIGHTGTMKSFRAKSLSSGLFLLALMRAIEPRAINEELITPGSTDEEKEQNARYALSVARKCGAVVFITYEDIVEVKPKMIMLLLAACMAFDKGFRDEADESVAEDAAAAARKTTGKKKKKKKTGASPALASAKVHMAITKGAKLKKGKAKAGASSALEHAKMNMAISKGTKLKKGKGKAKASSALQHAKVNMEVTKGKKLKKRKGGKKPSIPAWVLEEMKGGKTE